MERGSIKRNEDGGSEMLCAKDSVQRSREDFAQRCCVDYADVQICFL